MLKFKEGQTYICTEAAFNWWTEGKEYTVKPLNELETYFNNDDTTHKVFVLDDDEGTSWRDTELSASLNKFKLKKENKMLNFKEGQTYICTKTDKQWWTEGKEYKVERCDECGLCIFDNNGVWHTQSDLNNIRFTKTKFKLKEEPQETVFDLNKLTTDELRIYCDLVDAVSDAQYRLDEFILSKMKNM